MNKTLKEFLKFWAFYQLPLYGGILWLVLKVIPNYWLAWFITNQIFIILVFPFFKKGIFKV